MPLFAPCALRLVRSADSFLMKLEKLGTPDVYFTISLNHWPQHHCHYSDVIMGTMASQITSLTIVYSTFYSGADQRKHQSSASLAFARGIHRWPVNSPHKGPVTRKMFPFDDVIMVIKSVHRNHVRTIGHYDQANRCLYFEIVSLPGDGMKCGFTSVKQQKSLKWLLHWIPSGFSEDSG